MSKMKLKRIAAVLIGCLMMLSAGFTAFGDDVQATDDGAQSVEETGAIDPEPADNEEESEQDERIEDGDDDDPDADDMQYTDVMDVLLPYDISFDVVIVRTSKTGIVASREFKIANKGEGDVTVKILSACVDLSDSANFTICDTAELPKDGNNIYVEMICASGESTEAIPLTGTPSDSEYAYYLESGAEGTFWLEGTVNEFGDIPWSDISIKVSLCFSMEGEGAVISPRKAQLQAQKDSENAAAGDAEKELLDADAAETPEKNDETVPTSDIEDSSEPAEAGGEEKTSETAKDTERESKPENDNSETENTPES